MPYLYAPVVRVELDVDDVLMVRAGDGDGGRESDFYWGVDGSKHDIFMGVCQRNDKVGHMRGGVLSEV